MDPPCEQFVPGYGDVNAHFHVIGDHPGVHGGTRTGIPFTGQSWSSTFFDALERGGLVREFDPETETLECPETFFSYLSMCSPESVDATGTDVDGVPGAATNGGSAAEVATDGTDTDNSGTSGADDLYARLEPYFDSELRAITAHVLLPVGPRAVRHVLATYTSHPVDRDGEPSHATLLDGSGWLVLPIADPAGWSDDDADRLVDALRDLRERDYRQQSDLGRFLPGGEPYLVR